jgi:predicted nucleic acid-binding protein
MRYVDTSAVLRVLFSEPGPVVPLDAADRVASSELLEVEAFRALERARLTGHLDDSQAAIKRKELADLLAMLDLAPIDRAVINRAKSSFGVNVRALDAIHVATAEILAAEAEGEPLEFWTHDERQRIAALARGLSVQGL